MSTYPTDTYEVEFRTLGGEHRFVCIVEAYSFREAESDAAVVASGQLRHPSSYSLHRISRVDADA